MAEKAYTELDAQDRERALRDKDTKIMALAVALERHGYACRVQYPADPCYCIGCESARALRLAGRLP